MPDGYLGPNTYIPLWLIMIPIWYYAGQWLKTNLRTKQVPYLALAAAFSFVIMMFNVPIPGGRYRTRSRQRVGRNHIGAVGGSRNDIRRPAHTVLAFW